MLIFVPKSSPPSCFHAFYDIFSRFQLFHIILRGFHPKTHRQTYSLAKDSLGNYQTSTLFIKHPQWFRWFHQKWPNFRWIPPKCWFLAKSAPFRTRLEIINIPQGILMVSGVAGTQKLIIYRKWAKSSGFWSFSGKSTHFYLISMISKPIHAFRENAPPIPTIFLRDYWGFHARARKLDLDHKIIRT